ncbi:hypothetical protein ACFPH7_01195 [Arcanobacterium bovis]|nr:hypothetical protein [Arcanobacterium bovis]
MCGTSATAQRSGPSRQAQMRRFHTWLLGSGSRRAWFEPGGSSGYGLVLERARARTGGDGRGIYGVDG